MQKNKLKFSLQIFLIQKEKKNEEREGGRQNKKRREGRKNKEKEKRDNIRKRERPTHMKHFSQ